MSTLVQIKSIAVVNTLRGCQIFAGLSSEDLAAIADTVVVKPLAKGEYLFRESQPSLGFYVVQAGAVNVHRVNAAGKEQVIHIFRTGESFAEATLASDRGYPADARAVESTQVLLVQKAGFLALVRRQPELALRMLGAMSLRLRAMVGQLEDLMMKDVETRLANWLLKRCQNPQNNAPVTIELTITKRTLAAELGTVSETLSRTLARFREQKLLAVKGRRLTLLEPPKMLRLLQRNLGE